MGTRVKYAMWRKVGRIYIVKPPDWPKNVELSFTDQVDMVEWALGAHVMLKDDNRRNNDRFTTRNPRRDMATL